MRLLLEQMSKRLPCISRTDRGRLSTYIYQCSVGKAFGEGSVACLGPRHLERKTLNSQAPTAAIRQPKFMSIGHRHLEKSHSSASASTLGCVFGRGCWSPCRSGSIFALKDVGQDTVWFTCRTMGFAPSLIPVASGWLEGHFVVNQLGPAQARLRVRLVAWRRSITKTNAIWMLVKGLWACFMTQIWR